MFTKLKLTLGFYNYKHFKLQWMYLNTPRNTLYYIRNQKLYNKYSTLYSTK